MNIRKCVSSVAVAVGLLFSAAAAHAVPALQLGIKNGTYNTTTENTVATGDTFTLYAFGEDLESLTNYFVSIALFKGDGSTIPAPPPGLVLGSIKINGGAPINVTSDMKYGTPPIEDALEVQSSDGKDLGPHGVFPTYFTEFGFDFDSGRTTATCNVQTDATCGDNVEGTSGSMLYVPIEIDISLLAAGYGLHFDLYNKVESTQKDDVFDIGIAAPFSKDAGTLTCRDGTCGNGGGGGGGGGSAPEPATLALVGLGLLGAGMARRRQRKA